VVVVVVVVIGLMVKGTRILVVDPPKSWLRVPQKVMPRNPDKLAYANYSSWHLGPQLLSDQSTGKARMD